MAGERGLLIFKADSCWDLPRGNLTHSLDAKGGLLCVLIKLLSSENSRKDSSYYWDNSS